MKNIYIISISIIPKKIILGFVDFFFCSITEYVR